VCNASRNHQRVAILIDQVDALADILDRRSERLNVLLDVIHGLSSMPTCISS